MALNITFTGNVFNELENQYQGNEIQYQAYFKRNSVSSSPSKWNTTRLTEYGQYNINLGDGDWLTNGGSVAEGDKVLLLFWTPNTLDRTSTEIDKWSFIEITIDSREVYITDVQVKPISTPICDFIYSIDEQVVSIQNRGSSVENSWSFNGIQHYQEFQRYNQDLFPVNDFPPASVEIDWDFNAQITTHSIYDTITFTYPAGTYNPTITLRNYKNLVCSQEFTYQIRWSEPIVNFEASNWTPLPEGTNGLGEEVFFTNKTIGYRDDTYWEWLINSSSVNNNKSIDFIQSFQASSPGEHFITLKCHWFDGFDWNISDTTKTLLQDVWDVSNGLTWTTPTYIDQGVYFTPDISGDVSYINVVEYSFNGQDIYHYSWDEDFDYIFTDSFSNIVIQNIKYHNGFSNQEKIEYFTVILEPYADFDDFEEECGKRFVDKSNGLLPFRNQWWEIRWGSEVLLEKSNVDILYYGWPFTGVFTVWHKIEDANGNIAEITKEYEINECPHSEFDYRRGGGGDILVNHKFPRIKVKKVDRDETEDDINITIISVNEE